MDQNSHQPCNEAIEALKSGLAETETRLEAAVSKIAAHASTIASLEAEKVVLEGQVSDLTAEKEVIVIINDELQAKIEELTAPQSIAAAAEKASEAVKPVLPDTPFEVDGKAYRFISPVFVHKKSRVTAADALLDQSLLSELVNSRSGSIQEVK